jgi:signal transduction histidine kinase
MRVMAGDRIPPFETTRLRKDGSPVAVEVTYSPIVGPDGQFVGISSIDRDVGERHAIRRQQQAFLEAVSHDLKNPLAAVRAQAQLLERRLRRGVVPDPEALRSTTSIIEQATRRMQDQLDELQDVVRLRAGHPLELRIVPTDLVALARAAAEEVSATRQRTIRLASDEPVLVGSWDPLRLRRVFDNLIDNAVKYSDGGSEVTVSLARTEYTDGSWAVAAVRDNGVGIPPADLPHVFEPYRRGSNVGDRIGGAGIGLSGVHQIVEQHGGTIGVESVEGQGSTFTIALPLTPTAAPGAAGI